MWRARSPNVHGSLGLAIAAGIFAVLADRSEAEPLSLSNAEMSAITAGGIVSDATSAAAGYGKAPRTASRANASIDRATGEARARGRGRGPRGSDGNASISVADEGGDFSTTADADGTSGDRSTTSVSAEGKGKLSSSDYDGGSAANARAPNARTRSDTTFTPDSGELSSVANAEGTGSGNALTGSSTDVEGHVHGDDLGHRTRASGLGDDTSASSVGGNLRVGGLGHAIKIVTRADSRSSGSSTAEVRHIVIRTNSGAIVRSVARSSLTGAAIGDPSARIDIAVPGDGGSLLSADRAARRAGEARASSIIVAPAAR